MSKLEGKRKDQKKLTENPQEKKKAEKRKPAWRARHARPRLRRNRNGDITLVLFSSNGRGKNKKSHEKKGGKGRRGVPACLVGSYEAPEAVASGRHKAERKLRRGEKPKGTGVGRGKISEHIKYWVHVRLLSSRELWGGARGC